jgi:hypothetical protein
MKFIGRVASIVTLSAAAMTGVAAQDSPLIPRPALRELLLHVASSGPGAERGRAFFVVVKGFPDTEMAEEVALAERFPVYAFYDDIMLDCVEVPRPKCKLSIGDRTGTIARVVEATSDRIVVRVVVSTFVQRRQRGRLSPEEREIHLIRSDGQWRVEKDQLLWRS